MTVVNPDSIAGITSVTSSGTTLEFYDVNGNLLDVSANLTGELTVGTGATISSPGASIIDFETNGSERLRIGSSGQIGIAGANYGSSGQVLTSAGSGSAVSWTTIPAQATIANNADNRVITGGSGVNLNGEANLTWDGSSFSATAGTGNQFPFQIRNDFTPNSQRADYGYLANATSNNSLRLGSINSNGGVTIQSTRMNDSAQKHDLHLNPDGGDVSIGGVSPSSSALTVKIATNKHIGFSPSQSEVGNVPALVAFQDNGSLTDIGFRGTTFRVATASAERFRITSNGHVLIGTSSGSEQLVIKRDDAVGPTITLENDSNLAYINNWGSTGGGSGRRNRFEINATSQAQASICAPYITFMPGGTGDSYEKVRITSDELRNSTQFYSNKTTIASNKTITTDYNHMTIGNMTINSGVTVTVNSGARWVIV